MRKEDQQKLTGALAGNPNVGKSTLFNALTGLRQHTGNWPGKTVGVAQGYLLKENVEYTFVDLPGTYTLNGSSEDEKLAGEYIRSGNADCTIVVCDGSSLERSLILALQILDSTSPVVVCVNLMDDAERKGISIDDHELSKALGAPVVLTAAGKKQGIEELLGNVRAVSDGCQEPRQHYEDPIEAAEAIAQSCIITRDEKSQCFQEKLDRLLTGKRFGVPVMLLLLFVIIWLTVWGANYPSQILSRLFDWGYILLCRVSTGALWWIRGFLIDGMYATSARVISVMLPPMAIFFPLFTILEDVGYLPRMAFLLDGGMRRCGGCGKQALTLCMGLGCNAVGVTGCRIMDSPRERLLGILTNSMVPCNGRFPTLIVLGSLFFSGLGASVGVAGCVVLGVIGAMLTSGVLSHTVLRHEQSVFLMEMPPYRRPRIGQILVRSLIDRTLHIAGRALKVAAPAGGLLWVLANTSVLSAIGKCLDPIGHLMGMNGVILLAFLFCLPANELFIPVVLMAVTGAKDLQSVTSVSSALLLQVGWTWKTAVCTMVFTLFHWPCATTLMTVYKETGSKKETAAAFLMPTAVGILLCVILNLLL